jgi:hypothetical protein
MHMAWTRAICGRLESRYRYTGSLIYNNFITPINATKESIDAVDKAALDVLLARENYKNAALADLYDAVAMPSDLLKAHKVLDKAVDKAYGYTGTDDDASRVAFMFALYERETNLLAKSAVKKRTKKA